jgi:hypothetical protein
MIGPPEAVAGWARPITEAGCFRFLFFAGSYGFQLGYSVSFFLSIFLWFLLVFHFVRDFRF